MQFVRRELITQILRGVYAVYMNFFVTFETEVQQSTFQNGIWFLIFGVLFFLICFHYTSAEINLFIWWHFHVLNQFNISGNLYSEMQCISRIMFSSGFILVIWLPLFTKDSVGKLNIELEVAAVKYIYITRSGSWYWNILFYCSVVHYTEARK